DGAGAVIAFFAGLSEHSRRLRFHGTTVVDRSVVERFLDPDWVEHGALVGQLADEAGETRVVAVAEYVRLRDPAVAEVAFAVADELQLRGAGTRLLEQLAARAPPPGVPGFRAERLPHKAAML